MRTKPLPTWETLHRLFRYDPKTGDFFWRERGPEDFEATAKGRGAKSPEACAASWNTRFAGTKITTALPNGHIYTSVFGRKLLVHRVAWKMIYDMEPDEIDHVNGDPSDNRLTNLRDVPHHLNGRNLKRRAASKSGVTGVTWFGKTQKWHARIMVDRKSIFLGAFKNFDDAVNARRAAEIAHGFHENHGRR